jgi:hypothetical protein
MRDDYDVTTVLLEMGMDRTNATLSIPFMWFMPATTDAYSPEVIMIIESLQARLSQMGYPNAQRGFVDKATANALNQLAGRNWRSKTWLQIYGDVLHKDASGAPKRSNAMGYSGMGALPATDWCSTKNPQGTCKPIRGIVLPMTIAAADQFKSMQDEINRVAHMTNTAKVAVDGRIGPGTLSAANAALKKGTAVIGFALPGYPNVDALAANADVVTNALDRIANSLKAPRYVAGKQPAAPPSGTGGQVNPPREMIIAAMPLHQRVQQSVLFWPAVLGLMVGGFWYMEQKKKGKKKPLASLL